MIQKPSFRSLSHIEFYDYFFTAPNPWPNTPPPRAIHPAEYDDLKRRGLLPE